MVSKSAQVSSRWARSAKPGRSNPRLQESLRTSVGFTRVIDPVLYLHPRFSGVLEQLMQLEVRSLNNFGISVKRAQIENVLTGMEFVHLN